MSLGIVGKKCGMSRVFQEDGTSIPVSVIHVAANNITQIKDAANDGYCAVQIATDTAKRSRVIKPQAGHFAKANVEPCKVSHEFRLSEDALAALVVGAAINL